MWITLVITHAVLALVTRMSYRYQIGLSCVTFGIDHHRIGDYCSNSRYHSGLPCATLEYITFASVTSEYLTSL